MMLAARVAALAAPVLVHTVAPSNVLHANPAADFCRSGGVDGADAVTFIRAWEKGGG
ncbi:MAG: hypothetical protein KF864_00100 [Phycisphaeraceae bacterium]|nr:hypothetical protein [Phycisphaeraceae bacterium]